MSDIIRVSLIRHGKTVGNLKRQYIGRTDQPLCREGIEEIKQLASRGIYPKAELVFSSPLTRCLETSALIYEEKPIICPKLAECDFGELEGKSFSDLKDNKSYNDWVESNGALPFPSGESTADFISRCVDGFTEIIQTLKNISSIAIICHGGTIMSILDSFSYPNKPFYDWQVKNGGGYIFDFDTALMRACNVTNLEIHTDKGVTNIG